MSAQLTTFHSPALSPAIPINPLASAISPPRPQSCLIGGDPTNEHPLLAWNIRTNVRLNRARLYVANERQIKLERQAKAVLRLPAGTLQLHRQTSKRQRNQHQQHRLP